MHKSECQITERREWIVQSTSNLLRLLLYSKTYNLKLGLKWAMQTIYSYKLCYYFLVICKNFAASQDSNYTDSNVNSSMVETVKHFLEDFLHEYEKNPGERSESVCHPSPCHESAVCVVLGEERRRWRCVCPAGHTPVRHGDVRYCGPQVWRWWH